MLDEMRGQLAGDAARALCRVLPHVAGPSHAHVLVRRALGGGGEGEDGGGDDDGDGGGVPTTLPAWQGQDGITHRDQISRSGNPSL